MSFTGNDPLTELIAKVRTSTRAAGRLMSLVIDRPELVGRLVPPTDDPNATSCLPRPAQVIGITGPPGAGKSTLVDALLARLLCEDPARRVFVAAVDPSSPFTGGAILGDRVRMMRHALDERVFIRSLATRGELGGVCRGVTGSLAVAALWGADIALVETVGVGQNEIDVARLADVTTLVLAPGQGDGVQWLKAGLMEIADLFVVNKSDRDGADALVAQLQTAVERMASLPRRHTSASTLLPPGEGARRADEGRFVSDGRNPAMNIEHPRSGESQQQHRTGTPSPGLRPPSPDGRGLRVVKVSAENGSGIDELLVALGLVKEVAVHG